MNITLKTLSYLLDGFIQKDFEHYGKPYVITSTYLHFIQDFLELDSEDTKNICDVFGLEMLSLHKHYDDSMSKKYDCDFNFRGFFKYDNKNYTFIGRFKDDFEVFNVCEAKNFEHTSPYDLTLELDLITEKYSILDKDINFLKKISTWKTQS
jgi:hypothetical protein